SPISHWAMLRTIQMEEISSVSSPPTRASRGLNDVDPDDNPRGEADSVPPPPQDLPSEAWNPPWRTTRKLILIAPPRNCQVRRRNWHQKTGSRTWARRRRTHSPGLCQVPRSRRALGYLRPRHRLSPPWSYWLASNLLAALPRLEARPINDWTGRA